MPRAEPRTGDSGVIGLDAGGVVRALLWSPPFGKLPRLPRPRPKLERDNNILKSRSRKLMPTIIWSSIVVLDIRRTRGITKFPFLLLLILGTPVTKTFLAGLPVVRTKVFNTGRGIVGCEWQIGD